MSKTVMLFNYNIINYNIIKYNFSRSSTMLFNNVLLSCQTYNFQLTFYSGRVNRMRSMLSRLIILLVICIIFIKLLI